MRQQAVAVRGRRVVFREAGQGPPVLLVPGLGLSGRFYQPTFAALGAAGLRLVVPDPPGFGSTRAVPGVADVDGMAAFMADFAQSLGIARAAWIGHSLGAQVCLALAAACPQRASALVLVGPTGLARRARLSRQAFGLAYETARVPWPVVRRVATDYLRTSPVRYLQLWRRAAKDRPLERAPMLRCPCRVVVGDRDRVVSRPGLARLLQVAPFCEVVYVPGAGHGLPGEDPAGFHGAVIPFLTARLYGGAADGTGREPPRESLEGV